MKITRFPVALSTSVALCLSVLVFNTSNVSAQEPTPAPVEQTPCSEYATTNYGTGYNWTCFGNILTVTDPAESTDMPDSTPMVINTDTGETIDPMQTPGRSELRPESRQGPTVSPRARIDDSHAVKNYEKIIWNCSDGTHGATAISMRIAIYNHSGNISIGFWDEVPIELRFKLRIREDRRPFQSDLDVYEYSDATEYSLGVPALYGTVFEPYWDEGYNQLPYPSENKRYFWDMYDIYIAAEGKGWLTASLFGLGSSQSDRVTCGPVAPCKFVAGDT